tara:strand:- start:2355 stop:3533 length:1179 start_codon:yes stop_codon:yes gene_type:complete
MATQKGKTLPASVQKRLQPFIDKGIQNGIFSDNQPVVALYRRKATELKDTVTELGGMKNANAQRFVANCVMTDLSAMLRQKSYVGHLDIWSCDSRTTRTGRQMANIFGQVVIEDGDSTMDSALFKMSLWDEDASLADDIASGITYSASISCKNLDMEILDLKPLSGMTVFTEEEYEHADRTQILRDTYEVTPIAELEENISRNRNDFRMVEATVSYAGVQTSKTGNAFGKMLLKDESTMTIEAIESGEGLMLNALCDTETANRFGKYSEVLALVTTSMSDQYGLSSNIQCAVGIVTIAPPVVEAPSSGDDKEDNASDYFNKSAEAVETITLDDDETEDADDAPPVDAAVEEEVEEVVEEATPEPAKKAEAPKEGEEGWTAEGDDEEWDDDWD